MANFNIPNLCGASPELNAASLKIESLENEITAKLDAAASDAAAAFNTALTDVKAGLDGLALDLPEVPNVNFQSELTSLINDIDKTTIEGIAAFNNKLAELEKDFGNTLKEKGLGLDKLVTDATSKLATGGDVCALAPNIEIPAANSGTGVTTEEVEDRVSNAATLTLSKTPKEILEVQGKKTNQSFFTNINYSLNGKIIVPKATGTYLELKAKYIITLIKEKPVEVKQALVPPEKEAVSVISANTDAVSRKSEFKINNLIKKLDSLTALNLPTEKINADITKATDAIKSDSFKAKMEADLALAAEERKKLFADPLNYKPITVPSGSVGEKQKVIEVTTPEVQNTVKVETVTKPNPVTKQVETVKVKKTEKSTISIKGIAMRKVTVAEWFHTKDLTPTLAKRKGSKLVDDMTKLTLKQQPYTILAVRGRPYYGEKKERRGFKFYAYDNPNEYGGDDYGVKYVIDGKDPKLIELSQQVYDDGEKQANPANMTIMRVKYIVLEKLDPNFKG